MGLELRRLHYFLVVAETLHFGRAAAALYISQPALSKQIRQLEEELGVTLLKRNTRRVTLTAAGRILLEEGKEALAQFDRVVADTRSAGRGDVGRLGVGFVSSLAARVVPAAATALSVTHPRIGLRLEQSGAEEQLALVQEGKLDAGLLWQLGPQPTFDDGMVTLVLSEQPLHVAVPAGHRLAGATGVPIAELRDELWIMARGSLRRGHRADLVALCRRHGFEPRVRAEVSGMDTMLGLVQAELGICAASALTAAAGHEGVAFVAVTGERIRLAAVHPASGGTPPLDAFLEAARRVCERLVTTPSPAPRGAPS